MEHFLTASAQRAWQRTAILAHAAQQPATPLTLLAAILSEESRAHQLLASIGTDLALLQASLSQILPVKIDFDIAEAEPIQASTDLALITGILPSTIETPQNFSANHHNDDLRTVLLQAREVASSQSGGRDIGTDHLIVALVHVPSAAQQILAAAGVTTARLTTQPAGETIAWTAPIEVTLARDWLAPAISATTEAYRAVDANANRCREGLRVIEDYARFIRNDRNISEQTKQLRHHLASALQRLSERGLLTARAVESDVGTTINTTAEYQRSTPLDSVRAACKRVQEALRSMEEFGKVINPLFAQQIEQLRYQSYTIEQQLLLGASSFELLQHQQVYLLVTDSQCHGGWQTVVKAALQAGVKLFQLREKQLPDNLLLERACELRQMTRDAGALLIINDRPDIALLADADGVHVGQEELPVAAVRKIVGSDALIGVSTHSIDQARAAIKAGADYLGVGPVFPSGTKSFDHFAGLEYVEACAAEVAIPWFAIGGICAANLDSVIKAGATRIATSSAIAKDADPYQAAYKLCCSLSRL